MMKHYRAMMLIITGGVIEGTNPIELQGTAARAGDVIGKYSIFRCKEWRGPMLERQGRGEN